MKLTEIWVNQEDVRKTRILSRKAPDLKDGEVLVSIAKYALTSNNVTYAVFGDVIGYWKYFPTNEEGWGKVTVWGMADVAASQHDDIKVGERLYGFFPMANGVVLAPGRVKSGQFTDIAPHRQSLPPLYNQYMRTAAEPGFLQAIENERCLYFPLFITAFVIADLLEDSDYFDAQQILIGSASSKTGFGLAHFLKNEGTFKGRIVGLTSPSNKAFVEGLGECDQVVAYGEETAIDANQKSVYVDMSGDGSLLQKLHEMLADKMMLSQRVGATHWDSERQDKQLPGPEPVWFFAPDQIAKRDQDWGAGVLLQKGNAASAKLAASLKDSLQVELIKGAESACAVWKDVLDNKIPANRGIMVSIDTR